MAERGWVGRRGVRLPGQGGLGDVRLGTRGWQGVIFREAILGKIANSNLNLAA